MFSSTPRYHISFPRTVELLILPRAAVASALPPRRPRLPGSGAAHGPELARCEGCREGLFIRAERLCIFVLERADGVSLGAEDIEDPIHPHQAKEVANWLGHPT
jgi:hypothetical protein